MARKRSDTSGIDPEIALLNSRLRVLGSLVNAEGHPNINELWKILKDLDLIKLNIKFFGYELAQRLASALPVRGELAPSHVGLKSKPSTQADLESTWAAYWCGQLKVPVFFHRKLWEYVYVLQALWENGCVAPEKSGLGFGCGTEPLPSYLAGCGLTITATDLPVESSDSGSWTNNQHASSRDSLFYPQLISREQFDQKVRLSYVDMREVPNDLRDYDFCWSICAMEHLGSIKKGLDFVRSSLDTLKPGGYAVHTTEFNFANNDTTIDNWPTVLFQRRHFDDLAKDLRSSGHTVAELDFRVGDGVLDKFIDLPPYSHDLEHLSDLNWMPIPRHLKLSIDGFAVTCFGLIVRKAV